MNLKLKKPLLLKSLKSKIIVSITGIVIVSLTITTFFLEQKAKTELSKLIAEKAFNRMEATKLHVESQYQSILYHKSVMLHRRKMELKNNTSIGYEIINSAYQTYIKGLISEDNAKEIAIENLNKLRYDNEVGYFWINDTTRPLPKMIMHPTLPELDGTILDKPEFNCALGRNENLFKAFVDVCLENKEGFVDYLWPKPLPQGLSQQQPKLSYVKLFKPWNWIIGTGVYIDDIDKDVQDRFNAVIKDLNNIINKKTTSNESGYFFIFNEENKMLVHPSLAGTDGSNLVDPLTNRPILKELKDTAMKDTPSMEYLWDKPGYEGIFHFPKRAYVTYYEPLGWYICTSVYKEEIEASISDLTKTIIFFSIIFFSFAFIISVFTSQSITKPLKNLVKSISKTDSDGIPIETIPNVSISELQLLSNTINNMINSISDSRKALKKSENKYRALVESTSDWIWEVDRNGVFTYASPQIYDISGYRPEEVLSKKPFDFMEPEEGKRIQDLLELIMEHRHNIIMEENIAKHKNGSEIIYETSGVPIVDDNGNVTGYRAVSRDITARKISEQALKNEKEITEAALNSQQDTFFLFEPATGKAIRWNRVFTEITGYTDEEVAAFKAPDSYYSKSDLDKLSPIVDHILKKGTGTIELDLICKDGKTIPTEYNVSVITDENNNPIYFISIGRDITERKQIEEKIRKDLEEKEIMLKEIHHRVKNNLAVITGLLYLQSKRIKNKEQAFAAFEESRNRIFSMALVHEQLYNSGDFTKIDMKPYVHRITSELRQTYAHESKITLDLKIQGVFLDVNRAVPCGLILNELISNAYKHAFPKDKSGDINISFKHTRDKKYELCVQDNGIGLPKNIDPQSNNTLGIHLVSMLTKQLDGELNVIREEGTCFSIQFTI